MPKAPKRQAVGSPEAKDLNTCDRDYAPIAISESEADDEMREPWDYLHLLVLPLASPMIIVIGSRIHRSARARPTWRGLLGRRR